MPLPTTVAATSAATSRSAVIFQPPSARDSAHRGDAGDATEDGAHRGRVAFDLEVQHDGGGLEAGGQGPRFSLGHHPALDEDADPVADLLDLVQQVR